MSFDSEGCEYPCVDEQRCINCGKCLNACPIINVESEQAFTQSAYIVQNTDEAVLRQSTSGGAFTAFATTIIEMGGVVFGAGYDRDGKSSYDAPLNVRHMHVETVEDLRFFRNSKYVQSEIGEAFKEIRNQLREGREVLFCGTPCQVEGLKTYLHRDFDNLILLDIACHGVPSDLVFQSYLKKLGKMVKTNIKNLAFRKLDGWDKQTYISTDGRFFPICGIENLYMEAFNKSAILRKSCYHCKYAKIQRSGDCSLADFWGLGRHGFPFKQNVMKGVSLVLINNDKGLKRVKELDDIYMEERSLEEALNENANLQRPSTLPLNRNEIIASFIDANRTLNEMDAEFHIVNRSLKARIKNLAIKCNILQPFKSIYNVLKIYGNIK
jgi:ferredoxin